MLLQATIDDGVMIFLTRPSRMSLPPTPGAGNHPDPPDSGIATPSFRASRSDDHLVEEQGRIARTKNQKGNPVIAAETVTAKEEE